MSEESMKACDAYIIETHDLVAEEFRRNGGFLCNWNVTCPACRDDDPADPVRGGGTSVCTYTGHIIILEMRVRTSGCLGVTS